MGLPDALKLAGGESKHGGRKNPTILGDACEALLAALYRDAGLERTRGIFREMWREEFEQVEALGPVNPKSELQEWAASKQMEQPRYQVVDRKGPDHQPVFTVELTLGAFEPVRAKGKSRQDAEKAAAKAMLDRERPQ
jgi:ribonuclease-3